MASAPKRSLRRLPIADLPTAVLLCIAAQYCLFQGKIFRDNPIGLGLVFFDN